MKYIATKIFSGVALCCALASQGYSFHTHDDRIARAAAVSTRCETAIANNERVKAVDAACSADEVVQHYAYVQNVAFLAFTLVALGACLAFLYETRRRPIKSHASA